MKKIKSVEKIILLFVVFAFICGISTVNYASGDVNDIMNIPYINGNSTTNPTQNPAPAPTTPDNNNAANIPDNNATTNSNISAVQNQNTNSTSLPKTGVNDTAMWILVIACVVAAIYTYKKVRDYNV